LNSKQGFTLIELVIVVAIMAILSIIALQVFGPQQAKARDSKRLANIKYVTANLELYMNDYGVYPVVGAVSSEAGFLAVRSELADKYGERIRSITDPSSLNYSYEDVGSNFCLCAALETDIEANSGPSCAFGGTTHFCVTGIQ
jgi:prepilin-type N-terminal cleavage/methylation domain-containing protein